MKRLLYRILMSIQGAKNRVVFVTGFGPFDDHDVNASWEAVKLLRSLNIEDDLRITLHIDEVPVRYKYVSEYVARKWAELKPDLVVHVGVSRFVKNVTLEQSARCGQYTRLDIAGLAPTDGKCKPDVPESNAIVSGFDMQLVSRNVNNLGAPCKVDVSHDAGKFLCEFIYFCSLYEDNRKAAFIHVPKLDVHSSSDVAQTLKLCIGEFLKQLDENEKGAGRSEKKPDDSHEAEAESEGRAEAGRQPDGACSGVRRMLKL